MMIIDLSHPITSGMPVFPGDPEVRVAPALSVPEDVVAVSHLTLGSHSGTHIDAPAHTVIGGLTIDQFPLEQLQGSALHLRILDPQPHQLVSEGSFDAPLPETVPPLVVITAGWDAHFTSPLVTQHPVLSPEVARLLVTRGMRVLAIDWLNPDATEQGEDFTLPVHEIVLGGGGAIVENLRSAHELPGEFHLTIAPLPLAGADGAPVRAFALLPEESAPHAAAHQNRSEHTHARD